MNLKIQKNISTLTNKHRIYIYNFKDSNPKPKILFGNFFTDNNFDFNNIDRFLMLYHLFVLYLCSSIDVVRNNSKECVFLYGLEYFEKGLGFFKNSRKLEK